MSLELDVLRALLRLARRRTPPTLALLLERVDCDELAIRSALKSLARDGLVERTTVGLRLSMPGLAVAVACAQRPRRRVATAPKPAIAAAPASSTAAVGVRRRRAA